MALNALSKFTVGCKITVSYPPNFCVKVKSLNDKTFIKNFVVDAANAAVTQRIEVKRAKLFK